MLVELAGAKFPTTLTMKGVQKIIIITKVYSYYSSTVQRIDLKIFRLYALC